MPNPLGPMPPPLRREGRTTHVENRWIKVHCDDVLLDSGTRLSHWMVDYQRTGVGVVPVLGDGRVLLGLHYRYCAGRWGWEIVAGTTDDDEGVEATAHRELAEETGHRAGRMTRLGDYHPAPGLGNEHFHLFVAEDLEPVAGARLDRDEIHALEAFSWDDVESALARREIFDGFTLTGLMWWRAHRDAPTDYRKP